ncbi:ATP-binding protein [Herbaspirillum huttiense]|uniref:ATP-binding protein n=1 Tax=Herbaspirillum huttiense TaxID=863372 RepID=UPI002176E0A5|nr:SbcC/MukB-like Walker B domain-containing protein [Herbaspirillum huttiense]UWE15647.1 hypothetical protein NY669_21575 [Herbaspirillum huttiense]
MLSDTDVGTPITRPDLTLYPQDSIHVEKLKREELEQFKLVKIQSFNWGTFSHHLVIDVSPKGMLFIGPSGSGKSTIFDSHASLLTPPNWVNFNVAARESESRQDRNLATYIRGVWGEQTGGTGEIADQQLRKGPTWSAIAETYRNGEGRIVTLAHVYWIRTASNVPKDVGKRYLVADRDLDLGELKFFPQSQFNVRRFKTDLIGVYDTDEFSQYQERFRSHLGIETRHALKLLHKTQSAKNLGGLTDFLRDFMLDEPRTRSMANDLVEQFSKLDAAHNEVVSASLQIKTLLPARERYLDYQKLRLQRNEIEEIKSGVENFLEERRGELLLQDLRFHQMLLEGQLQDLAVKERAKENTRADYDRLQEQRRGMGGEQLGQLEEDLQKALLEADDRETKRVKVREACLGLGLTLPDSPPQYAELVQEAKTALEIAANGDTTSSEIKNKLVIEKEDIGRELSRVQAELASLARLKRSNIPSHLTDIRQQMANDLKLSESELPFAGELIEVKVQEKGWQGAIERVLRGFALTMLVDEDHYQAVSGYVDRTFLKGRLVYIRTLPQSMPTHAPKQNSVVHKVAVADGSFRQWINSELRQRFDLECLETAEELRARPSGVTKKGQIKMGGRRHEKDDRTQVDDSRHWVLGADTKIKVDALFEDASQLNQKFQKVSAQIEVLDKQGRDQVKRVMALQTIADQRWSDIDSATPAIRARELEHQATQLRESSPDLKAVDARIAVAISRHKAAEKAHTDQSADVRTTQRVIESREQSIASRATKAYVPPTPAQRAGLMERLTAANRTPTLDSISDDMRLIERKLGIEVHGLEAQISDLIRKIEDAFADYNRCWPAESGGLDPKMGSFTEYDAKLTRLQVDDLPRVEKKFKQLLNEQSNQHIALLANQIDQERRDIAEKMDAVNKSLRNTEFNPGTYLYIDPEDKTPSEAKEFKANLRAALANTLSVDDQEAEQRFQLLKGLINRLASQQPKDLQWKTLALDVRLHVEFIARELRVDDGSEVEVYRSGAGKSGGQRQKLTATCLAAALRYQLGGPGRLRPTFCTIFLDEAFDKADADFTEAAMKTFKNFGFQLIIATPIKSVMTIEPYVGGAAFVHIEDRRHSKVCVLSYDEENQRIDYTSLDGEAASDART